ncbi:hypothetical protein TA3x_004347 [Tundrisphaera sp. TA3]|uniref:hypothetical protein n=1 Tax=Tundrisphaera sp. TA3 TaxID=3435775 RepID=UPI003EB97A5A
MIGPAPVRWLDRVRIKEFPTMHDIYDPPPAPIPWAPPEAEPLHWTAGDLTVLASLGVLVVVGSLLAWRVEPTLALLILMGGALVIVESWFTALGFLHRRPIGELGARWKIFLAALLPWLFGLGFAAALMLGLFQLSDWAG